MKGTCEQIPFHFFLKFMMLGCAGCPLGRDIQAELEVIREFEPKFYAACMHTFGASYELTERYRKVKAEQV